MADKPVTEIVNLDAVLDALPDSPTTSDVYEATLPFSARDVAASATQRAINGGGGGGGSTPANVPGLQYLEWTFDGTAEQSVVFPAGTVLTFGCVVVHEEFNSGAGFFDLGTTDDSTAFTNAVNPATVDVLMTVNDLGDTGTPSPEGFVWGFPYGGDKFAYFATETTVVGTLTPDVTDVSGMLRFYFMACVPTAA